MRHPTAGRILAMVLLVLAVGGCVAEPGSVGPSSPASFPLPPPPTVDTPLPSASVTAELALPPALPLPARPYLVAKRVLELANGDRPLRTVVLFPSGEWIDGAFDVAAGRFPLVLFSHGLRGSPELYESSLTRIAEAGFVVVAPTYPHTSADAEEYDPLDVLNQPADASAVITAVLALAATGDDRLAGHIDPLRIAAIGHSAGGYTTAGLLSGDRDDRLRAAVVLSGSGLRGRFTGPTTAVLFVHGEDDDVVPYDYGHTTYGQVPWPKAFLTVLGGGHADYLAAGSPARDAIVASVLDFLYAVLYGDVASLARLPADAVVDGVTRLESTISFPPAATPAPNPSIQTTPTQTIPTPTATSTATPAAPVTASPGATAHP